MEEKRSFYRVKDENSLGMVRSIRDAPPAHFRFKIESFGLLSDFILRCGGGKIQTAPFVSCGFRWKLVLYPRGDMKRNGDDHLSLYLVLVDAASFPVGLQLHATFKLFLYDHIRKKYLIVERDVSGASVFHKLKTEDGFSRFIPLATFHDSCSGFKDGESCIFGAEVYVIENGPVVAKDACLTNSAPSKAFSYAVEFSKIPSDKDYECPSFRAGETKWFVNLRRYTCPEGRRYIHFALAFADPVNFPPSILTRWRKRRNNRSLLEEAVFVKGTMSIKHQFHGKHVNRDFCYIFRSSGNCWGYKRFMNVDYLEDASRGYVVNGKMNVEVALSLVVVLNQTL